MATLFGGKEWPKPLHVLRALEAVRAGEPLGAAAKAARTTAAQVTRLQGAADPVRELLGLGLHEVDTDHRQRAAQILGQLLLGRCAEIAFEDIFKSEMRREDFEVRDVREGRTDTDYRLLNGRGRPVYRVNIKFHGSPFRRAKELVGLEPEDCFALATYKIHGALEKQEREALPYIFAIVGVRHLTGDVVGRSIPSLLVEAVAFIDQAPHGRGKRDLEDLVVEHLVRERSPVFRETLEKILQADWYILSAARANRLLRDQLFERVFALRLRSFARAFRGAELDMHYSLTKDLVPLRKFLATLREEGPHKVTTLLERGDF